MSWNVSRKGRAAKVAEYVEQQKSNIRCLEPEEAFKNSALETALAVLRSMPTNTAVELEARGSQSQMSDGTYNQLYLSINPIWGFVD